MKALLFSLVIGIVTILNVNSANALPIGCGMVSPTYIRCCAADIYESIEALIDDSKKLSEMSDDKKSIIRNALQSAEEATQN